MSKVEKFLCCILKYDYLVYHRGKQRMANCYLWSQISPLKEFDYYFYPSEREDIKTTDAVRFLLACLFLHKKRCLRGRQNRVYYFAWYKWTSTWLLNRQQSSSRCVQHGPGWTGPCSKRGASSWSVSVTNGYLRGKVNSK